MTDRGGAPEITGDAGTWWGCQVRGARGCEVSQGFLVGACVLIGGDRTGNGDRHLGCAYGRQSTSWGTRSSDFAAGSRFRESLEDCK